MKLNRRNVLIGLATATVGGGAAFGSGAFSTVEADRSFSVATAGDSSAFLALGVVNSNYANNNDGTLAVTLDSNSGNGDGVNLDAVTDFGNVFTVANKGNSTIDVYVSNVTAGADVSSVSIANEQIEIDVDGNGTDIIVKLYNASNSDTSIVGSSSTGIQDLATGDNAQNIGIEVDTTGYDSSSPPTDLLGQITLRAE